MIYGIRCNDPARANTKIEFKGYEISISMDDRHLGRDLTRSQIVIYKGDQNVTGMLGIEGIVEWVDGPTGDDLFEVMQAIDKLASQVVDEDPDPLNSVSDRAIHNAFRNS